ncbi:MAG: PTS sugar transporter subunit IIB [Elusimicrobiota bacterium]
MIIFRVDDRLVHGQVVEGWLGTFNIKGLVIANDEVFKDEAIKSIMRFSTPKSVELIFSQVSLLKEVSFNPDENYMVLFRSLEDVIKAIENGVKIDRLNLGGIHYAKGRNFSFGRALFLSEEEKKILNKIISMGVEIYMQAIPQEKMVKLENL